MITNTHDLEHDRAADHEASQAARLEAMQQQLAEDLFEGYMSDNYTVIDEVDDLITGDTDTVDHLLKKLRDAYTQDGVAMRNSYHKIIACCCEHVAKRYDTADKVDGAYGEFEL